jgi:hypothetical protein
MTFRDLQKLIESQPNPKQTKAFERLRYDRRICLHKCTIEYWPTRQSVKKSSKFELPGPPIDSHGNVTGDNDIPFAVIDDVNKVSETTYKKQKLSPSFEMLKKHGFPRTKGYVSSPSLFVIRYLLYVIEKYNISRRRLNE